jgi:hypothetical protein
VPRLRALQEPPQSIPVGHHCLMNTFRSNTPGVGHLLYIYPTDFGYHVGQEPEGDCVNEFNAFVGNEGRRGGICAARAEKPLM